MQNEFEKQVQQKMEELQLIPSELVWIKVEKQITRKKDKRWILFFLFFLCLIVAGGIWLGMGNKNKILQTDQNKIETKNANTNSLKTQKETDFKNQKITSQSTQQQSEKATAKSFIEETKISYKKKASVLITTSDSKIGNKKNNELFNEKGKPTTVFQNSVSKDSMPSANSETKEKKQMATLNNDSSIVNKDKKEILQPTTNLVGDSTISKKKIAENNKWQKFITTQIGWSSYRSGLFNNDKAIANNIFASPSSISSGQNRDSLKKIVNGIAFSIGIEFRKLMGKRFFVNAGLQYRFYSTHIKVGSKRQNDTTAIYGGVTRSIFSYYTGANQNDYTNKYNIVEIPVSVSYRLMKKFPLHLSVGASYGYLISSNALTFDHSTNLYYYNKENNARNYVNLFSSLQYEFATKNKMKIKAGPVFQYTTSGIQKENRYGIPHLFFAGIKTDISF